MDSTLLHHLSRGSFNFLRPTRNEIEEAIPGAEKLLPVPQLIFLEDERSTPLMGFPVLQNRGQHALEEALEECLLAEEEAQFAYHNRDSFDSSHYASRWERYRKLLRQASENVVLSSYGQNYAGVFWLYHSLRVSRCIKMIPKRLLRRDVKIGRERGDEIKYKVFNKFVDRATALAYDTADELASDSEEEEVSLFPALLGRMRDNVLIFTEDLVSPDLGELLSYFSGCLKIDGRDFRDRFRRLEAWHAKVLQADPMLRGAAEHLLSGTDINHPLRLLNRRGYVRFLSNHGGYDPETMLRRDQVQVWESLLVKLKEFELLQALRKMVVPIEIENGEMVSRDRSANTTWVAGPPVLHVSQATRPIDFMSSWVVDPRVQRYGLVYDVTQFSDIISGLGRAEPTALDNAFRTMFRFQRRVNNLAGSLRLRLEKYLGDGAFYSGRQAHRLLHAAIHLQRYYAEAIEHGLPFDRGLRIALNYSQYRLLPLETSGQRGKGPRYEFFGHGIVELSRLVTGKVSEQVADFKNYLISRGYPEPTVNKFFAPLVRKDVELMSKTEETHPFFAYINSNGSLINEGIVATEPFVSQLDDLGPMYYGQERGRGYIALKLQEEDGSELCVGMRKLGVGNFKGLEQRVVYEIIDGQAWEPEALRRIRSPDLMSALERLFVSAAEARRKARRGARHKKEDTGA